jgi:hypothetical protein
MEESYRIEVGDTPGVLLNGLWSHISNKGVYIDLDLHADLDELFRACECAIRRGDTSDPAALHTLQQQLFAARNASTRNQTEATLQVASQYYRETVPDEVRTSTRSDLTARLSRLEAHLGPVDDSGTPVAAETVDDRYVSRWNTPSEKSPTESSETSSRPSSSNCQRTPPTP